ncbi:MAG: hypothetical protein LBU34_00540 [Planctomycetaceae bacterium]|jgi:hypothetical protein|nr:hypothetical protein [Planctomycetaceae bacterium]
MKHHLLIILAAVLLVAGCSKYSRPPLVQVEGTVQYKGKPLEKGTLVFDVAGSTTGNAEIVNGQIVNPTTFGSGDGIPAGNAKIAVYSTKEKVKSSSGKTDSNKTESKYPEDHPGNTTNNSMPEMISLIPEKYNNPQTSGFTCTLEKGKINTIHLELE